jgi:putative heme-binding domain-containing protein
MNFVLSTTWDRTGDVFVGKYGPDLDLKIVSFLNEGAQSAGKQLNQLVPADKLQPVSLRAQRIAGDARSAVTSRVQAISVIGSADYAKAAPALLPLLDPTHPAEVQSAALRMLDRFPAPELAEELIQRWPSLSPAARREALLVLLKRPDRIRAMLEAIEKGAVNPAEMSVAQQAQLRSHRDAAIRDQAEKVLGRAPVAARQSVVEAFQPALALRGGPMNGRKTFQARCISCHKLGNEGQVLGPDLATVKNAGKEKLLTNILDPNREVNSNYLSYLIETKAGESLTGLIVNESANSVTFRMAGGAESVVARANIASLQSQGKSLMPEGLEEGLSAQDMADLLEFIVATP